MKPVYIGGLDIGGTKIAAMIAGPDGPLARVTQPTAKTGSNRALPEQAIALLDAACLQSHIPLTSLKTIGVASCGPFTRIDGMLNLATPNICGGRMRNSGLPNDWEVIPLEQVLRERFADVIIENDCVAALSAEHAFGAVQDIANCVYATWSTGIGFGLCVDGRILHGKHGNAGHAGHMLLSEHSDARCGCGNLGDVEALCSGRNIGTRLNMTAVELFDAARQGNAAALEAAQRAAQWFGRALYNIVATLDTSICVIGGSVWMHHGEWLAPLVLKEIESRLPALTDGVTVVPAALGGLAADIGALSLAIPANWVPHWRQTSPWRKLSAAQSRDGGEAQKVS